MNTEINTDLKTMKAADVKKLLRRKGLKARAANCRNSIRVNLDEGNNRSPEGQLVAETLTALGFRSSLGEEFDALSWNGTTELFIYKPANLLRAGIRPK